MAHRDDDFLPVFLVRCKVAVYAFISVFYEIPKIWLGIDGNIGSSSKTIISACPQLIKKTRSGGTELGQFSQFTLYICTRKR